MRTDHLLHFLVSAVIMAALSYFLPAPWAFGITLLIGIGKGFRLQDSHFLTHESLLRVIDNLVDLTGKTSQQLQIGAINKAKLSAEEQARVAAKNWTIV